MFFVFFCKQKTAYEMRISDWSSDVCSSDLLARPSARFAAFARVLYRDGARRVRHHARGIVRCDPQGRQSAELGGADRGAVQEGCGHRSRQVQWRSEEHTSELQSLMRISYAVFCLKKKNTQPHNDIIRTEQRKTTSKN